MHSLRGALLCAWGKLDKVNKNYSSVSKGVYVANMVILMH